MTDPTALQLLHLLNGLKADIHVALAQLRVPAFVLDREGTVRWLNAAGVAVWPQAVNQRFAAVVTPDVVNRAREQFARKMIGEAAATSYPSAAYDADGRRRDYDVTSIALKCDEEVVGVFGVAMPARLQADVELHQPAIELTPRQHEVLRLLGEGRTTTRIASELGIAEETARNHIKALMRALGARSRLEAVVAAHRLRLL